MKIKTILIVTLLVSMASNQVFATDPASAPAAIAADNDSSFDAPAFLIHLNVYQQNQMVYCNFRTEFKCKSYAIEGKQNEGDEFKSLFYCNDELCVDSREWVDINFLNNEHGYKYFRIKTELPGGEVRYSQVRFVRGKQQNEVEIVNTVVSNYLYFRYTSARQALGYHYTISGVNGEEIKSDEPAIEGSISLETLPEGFYMISFRSLEGNIYHYKFFKTANL